MAGALRYTSLIAAIAQLVEHVIRNDGVGGSIPSCGTIFQIISMLYLSGPTGL
jgi:hypothetical protein